MSIRDDIQAEAITLGFSLAGVVLPQRPAHFSEFERWLDQGRHGSMSYLSAPDRVQRRRDPSLLLPEARSIISLALAYSSPFASPSESQAREMHGRVAAYAWGDDYHAVIPPRLDRLAERLSGLVGRQVRQRRYTDTGPILERDLAQQAGLGWIGKNTCLISPQAGSFFFLAELLVDVELEPDQLFPFDRCGNCRRCIEACPTACILPDRTIDANRCISYQTIENKGAIPAELRSQIGDWIFGCDICQKVCPWNLRFTPAAGDAAFAPRPGVANPILTAELKLSPQTFNLKFRNNPVLRARRRGYLRNVCVALGNSRDPAAVPDLESALLAEPELLIRLHAAWALGQINSIPARLALNKALNNENLPAVIIEIRKGLEGPSI